MAISLDKAFGIHPQAIKLRLERSEVLASNIANADTPGYKAKDFDFASALSGAKKQYQSEMTRTHDKHIGAGKTMLNDGLQFRIPSQPDTGDGNTVDVNVERVEYLKNNMAYNASVQFMTGRIKGLKAAITGQSK
ncbi:flagellar basal body rod protein FlgB [Catenovulum sp. SM1970]|uniref:flagellar basal body rod protein FlgB n=1 Tax=Marinifaba aquimaris TaxID=2741323 RepID=UPI001573E320|nr:flagellar basal body rod protein FlgB [Marinifaba aquimaris]NTS75404.1 flagellar basal body rod protein FlgB [Marinifaba aquimaris]